jgi:putative Holliday junction resolvase
MRCLGIDFGAKRIGLSHGEKEVGVATPLPALIEPDPEARWRKLGELIAARRITDLVVGYPFNMDGSAGFKAKEVAAFVAALQERFKLPVHLIDETLTTYMAEQTIAKKDRRGVRDSGLVDSRAACLILQDFLDHGPTFPPEAELG